MVRGCCVQVNASGPAAIESLSEVNDKARISVWPRSDHDIPSGSEQLSAAPPPQELPAASGAAAPARAEPIPWPPKPEGADGAPLRTSNVLPVAQSASVWQFRLRGEWKDFSPEEQVELSAGPPMTAVMPSWLLLWVAFPPSPQEWLVVLAGHSCGEKTLQLSRASGSHYEINLGTMTQLNTETRRERKIRRLTHKPPPPSKPSATVPREYGAQTRGIVASVSWLASSSTAEGERVTSCELQVKPPASNGHASDARVGKPVWRPTRLKPEDFAASLLVSSRLVTA